eukprot:5436628-Pleurochrysis_carterae.AAC.1
MKILIYKIYVFYLSDSLLPGVTRATIRAGRSEDTIQYTFRRGLRAGTGAGVGTRLGGCSRKVAQRAAAAIASELSK